MGYPTKLQPADGHLLVQKIPDEIQEKSAGGIVLPDSAKKKMRQVAYEVLAVGHGVIERYKVGDYVIYKDSSVFLGANVIVKDSAVFVDDDNGIVSVRQENVIAFLKKEDAEAHFAVSPNIRVVTA